MAKLTVSRGAYVRVVGGDRDTLGLEGRVVWAGESRFGGERCGIKLASGEVLWTAARRVVVVPTPGDEPERCPRCNGDVPVWPYGVCEDCAERAAS